MAIKLLRKAEVSKRRGEGATSTYEAVRDRRLTAPVKINPRLHLWPEFEIDTINAALIAGKTDKEIREIVAQLMEARPKLLPQFMASIPTTEAHAAA